MYNIHKQNYFIYKSKYFMLHTVIHKRNPRNVSMIYVCKS